MSVVNGFEVGLTAMLARMVEAARIGMGEAVNQAMDDAINEAPAVPLDEGTLRGSASCFVDGHLIAAGRPAGGNPEPLLTDPEGAAPSDMEIVGRVVFHSPYAAYQHEGARADGSRPVREYSHGGTGAKFLERKLSENRDEYMQIVRDRVEGGMRNA